MEKMKYIGRFFLLAMIGMIPLSGCQSPTKSMAHGHKSMAHEHHAAKQSITVQAPWARASAGMARAGAAFMTITNHTAHGDRLLAAQTNVSKRAELHTHIMEGAVMRMRSIPHIDIPAGKSVKLRPGKHHVMLMGLHNPLREGSHFPLTLEFEKAGKVQIKVMVKGAAANAKPSGHDHGHGHHMH